MLQPFSREHHTFLIVAQLLKYNSPAYKGLPTDTKVKVNYALQIYASQMLSHWKEEEEKLFAYLKGMNAKLDGLIHILEDDHEELRHRFEQLSGDLNLELAMNHLGELLELHIRMEERELFEKVQAVLSEKDWHDLKETLKQ